MKPKSKIAFHQCLVPALIAALLPAAAIAAPPPATLPTGASIANGTVAISNPTASSMQISNTPGAIVNWNNFSIGRDAAVNILQQSASSAILNRVTGAGGSEIFGQLSSNGRVFLINTNGILFGAGSRVDVSGLIASTRALSNADFLAGNYVFEGRSDGNITLENDARIRTSGASGSQVWLVANRINTQAGSSIQTPQGQTVLAAGDRVTVGDSGSGYMSFSVNASSGQSIEHLGSVAAERGAAGFFADNVVIGGTIDVSMTGSAHSAYGPAGTIHVAAARDVTLLDGARLNASGGQNGSGGRVGIDAGNRVAVARGADISADGGSFGTAGGRVDIAGNEVLIEPGLGGIASVHAAARSVGNNGTVSVIRRGPAPGVISSYLPVSTSGGSDYYPSVSFLDDGGFIVVWMEQNAPAGTIWNVDYSTIFARRFNADGQPVGTPFQVSAATNYQYDPKVIGLDGGGFFVVWAYKEARPAPGTLGWENHLGKLYGRMFDRNGVPIGSDIRISSDFGESDAARIVQLAGGQFLVTWNNETSNYPNPLVVGKRAQLFDTNGAPTGTPIGLLPAATTNGAMSPSLSFIIPVSSGGFAQVYQRNVVDAYGWPLAAKVFVQRYSNAGTPAGSEIALSSSHPNFFLESAITLAGGNMAVTLRTEDPVTRQYKLHFGIYGADGSPKRIDQPLDTVGSNSYSRLTALADGGFAVLWKHSATASGGDTDAYTRRFAADGSPIEAPRLLTNAGQVTGIDQTGIAAGSDGRYLAAWSENFQIAGTTSYTGFEIRASLITPERLSGVVSGPVAGTLPAQTTNATRPGTANGSTGPDTLCLGACLPPSPPVTEPEVVVIPPSVTIPVVTPPATNPAPPAVSTPGKENDDRGRRHEVTESHHSDDRRVTPTGQTDFVFPGEAKHFADNVEVRAVADSQGKVTRYELVNRDSSSGKDEKTTSEPSRDDEEGNRRQRH